MSSERAIENQPRETFNNMESNTARVYHNSNSKKIDINHLLSKVREKENKENKENKIFLVLATFVIFITGIIASL